MLVCVGNHRLPARVLLDSVVMLSLVVHNHRLPARVLLDSVVMLSLVVRLLQKCHILRQLTQQDTYICLCREP